MDQEPLVAVGEREEQAPERHQPLQQARCAGPVVEGEAEAGGAPLVGGGSDEDVHLLVPAGRRARIGMEEEQPRPLRLRRAGRELPAAPGLHHRHPRPVRAGNVCGAVLRAAVGDHDVHADSALFEARDAARQSGERRAESVGGVEGRYHDAEQSRHGADDGRWPQQRQSRPGSQSRDNCRDSAVETVLDPPAPGLQSYRQR